MHLYRWSDDRDCCVHRARFYRYGDRQWEILSPSYDWDELSDSQKMYMSDKYPRTYFYNKCIKGCPDFKDEEVKSTNVSPVLKCNLSECSSRFCDNVCHILDFSPGIKTKDDKWEWYGVSHERYCNGQWWKPHVKCGVVDHVVPENTYTLTRLHSVSCGVSECPASGVQREEV